MSRFFGSKKRRNKYITTAKEYYEDHYNGEESEVLSEEEEEIIQKISSLGAIRVKKTSSYMTQYEFDLPAEHEDDVYHRIFLSLEGQEVNIDAELDETFPIFLHAMVKQEYKGKVFESFEGLSVSNFLTLRTNNEKLARKILDTPKVSMTYMAIFDDIILLSINSSTLSAKLSSLDKLEEFFQFMTQLIKVVF